MGDINKMIQWMKSREGKVSYSQSSRLGPASYDCSSAVYFALIEGGFMPKGTMGNTESLFLLEGKLLQPILKSNVRKGDIFVAGVKGGSSGNNGHTGIFLDNQTIIHCTFVPAYGKNGICTTPAQGWMGDYSGMPVYYYRLKGSNPVGWYNDGNYDFYFFENGDKAIGYHWIGNKCYCFDKNGAMYKNAWTSNDKYKFYSTEDGTLAIGYHRVENKYYCFDKNGAMYKNAWTAYEGNRYFSTEDGSLAIGKMVIDSVIYEFDLTGKLIN